MAPIRRSYDPYRQTTRPHQNEQGKQKMSTLSLKLQVLAVASRSYKICRHPRLIYNTLTTEPHGRTRWILNRKLLVTSIFKVCHGFYASILPSQCLLGRFLLKHTISSPLKRWYHSTTSIYVSKSVSSRRQSYHTGQPNFIA